MAKGTLHQEVVRRLLLTGAQHRIERVLDKLHPADIAELFGALSPGELRNLLDVLVATGRAGRTLRELPEALLADFLGQLDDGRVTHIITRLPPDDAYRLLLLLPEDRRASGRENVPAGRREERDRLLRYQPGTAGALMTPRILARTAPPTAATPTRGHRRPGAHKVSFPGHPGPAFPGRGAPPGPPPRPNHNNELCKTLPCGR